MLVLGGYVLLAGQPCLVSVGEETRVGEDTQGAPPFKRKMEGRIREVLREEVTGGDAVIRT